MKCGQVDAAFSHVGQYPHAGSWWFSPCPHALHLAVIIISAPFSRQPDLRGDQRQVPHSDVSVKSHSLQAEPVIWPLLHLGHVHDVDMTVPPHLPQGLSGISMTISTPFSRRIWGIRWHGTRRACVASVRGRRMRRLTCHFSRVLVLHIRHTYHILPSGCRSRPRGESHVGQFGTATKGPTVMGI